MHADVLTVEQRVSTENLASGFTEQWASKGEFMGTVTERVSSLTLFQGQLSSLSWYQVRIPNTDFNISFANTRFKWINRLGQDTLLYPVRDPKRFGSRLRFDWIVDCQDSLRLSIVEARENEFDSPISPPEAPLPPVLFTGDGQTRMFYPGFLIQPGTSEISVNGIGLVRGVGFYEFADHVLLLAPPGVGVSVALTADRLR